MPKLLLREGSSYSRSDLRRLLTQEAPGNSTGLVEECFDELLAVDLGEGSTSLDDETEGDEGEHEAESELGDMGTGIKYRRLAVRMSGRWESLRIAHLVGAARLPRSGVDIEILPKIDRDGSVVEDRLGLMRMWQFAMNLRMQDHLSIAGVVPVADMPLHEWLIARFIDQLKELLGRGLRGAYVEREDNLTTVRGRVMVAENMRRNLFAPHMFQCRFEEFSLDRPENRLIRSALARIVAFSCHPQNRTTAIALGEELHEIPESTDYRADFALWREDRLMVDYQEIRQTCRWVLDSSSPAPVSGNQQMFGRFVRMNDVFERYVARWTAQRLRPSGIMIHEQARGAKFSELGQQIFCTMAGGKRQTLRPDMVVSRARKNFAVLDAKWKHARADGKVASRDDLFQMFAYAHHWLVPPRGVEAANDVPQLIALVYPWDGMAHAGRFDYRRLLEVKGWALQFQMPRRVGDGETRWQEGFVLPAGELPPELDWLEPARVAPPNLARRAA